MVSSAVEHCLHTAGVTGSIPVPPTRICKQLQVERLGARRAFLLCGLVVDFFGGTPWRQSRTRTAPASLRPLPRRPVLGRSDAPMRHPVAAIPCQIRTEDSLKTDGIFLCSVMWRGAYRQPTGTGPRLDCLGRFVRTRETCRCRNGATLVTNARHRPEAGRRRFVASVSCRARKRVLRRFSRRRLKNSSAVDSPHA